MAEINFAVVGFIAIIIGVVLILISALTSKKTQVEGGGVVLIGPIPIIGATSERALILVLALTVIFLLVFIAINFLR